MLLRLFHICYLSQITFVEVCSNNRVADIITSAIQKDPEWQQNILLSEDIAVWKMPSLRDAQERMTFDPHQEMDISMQDEVIMHVGICLRFSHPKFSIDI